MTIPVLAYPDAELVTLAVHDLLVPGNQGLVVTTFLRSGWVPPAVQINRIGGSPDQWDLTDYPIMRCAYYGVNRPAAWDLAAQGEATMMGMAHRAVYVERYDGEILIDSVSIIVGGQQLPDVDPDERRVVKDFQLGLRRPHRLLVT